MALLVTVVLGNEVEVFAADDNGSVHLGRDDGASQDTATDRDLASEGALLVCKYTVNSRPFWFGPSSLAALVVDTSSSGRPTDSGAIAIRFNIPMY